MRQIKFRGKRSKNGEWVYGGLVYRLPKHPEIVTNEYITHPDEQCEDYIVFYQDIYEDTVGRFTGLHDKNGKEIFEHDYISIIYKYDGIINGGAVPDQDCICEGEVVYMDSFVCFGLHLYKAEYPVNQELKECPYLTIPMLQFDLECDSIEVLGNTFDNPELLKGGEE